MGERKEEMMTNVEVFSGKNKSNILLDFGAVLKVFFEKNICKMTGSAQSLFLLVCV